MEQEKMPKTRQMQIMIHLLLTSGTTMEIMFTTIISTQNILKLRDDEIIYMNPIEIFMFHQAMEYKRKELEKELEKENGAKTL